MLPAMSSIAECTSALHVIQRILGNRVSAFDDAASDIAQPHPPDCTLTGAASRPPDKGLHSLTFLLNLSATCGLRGALRDCLGVV